MKHLALPMLLLSLALPADAASLAQSPEDPALAAMRDLPAFEGRWEGTGWSRRGPAEAVPFTSLELVESRLDGRVLVVEGLHHDSNGAVVHHALAVITWNDKAGHYDFRSFVSGRGPGNFTGRMEDGAFVWSIEMESGHIRYTIRIENGEWHEIGEWSADGAQWSQFFQMDLRRVSG